MEKYKYENITDNLDLYLYNQNETLVEKFSFSKKDLENSKYSAELRIWEFGDYTLVASVNASESYNVNAGNLNSFRIDLKAETNDTIRTKQDELYHGQKKMSLPFTGVVNRYDTIDIYKNTNHIEVNVSFENSYIPEEIQLKSYLKGNNGSFNYLNTCYPESNRVYLPHQRYDEKNGIYMQFTTMQLWIGSDLKFFLQKDFRDDKEVVSELNIVEEIAKNPAYDTNEELDQEDHFIINVVYNSDYQILELKVNDWYTIRNGIRI